MTFLAWPVVGLIWLLDRLWEQRRQATPPPRRVVHHGRPLTDTERQHRQALAPLQRERNDRVQEAMQITAIRRSMDAAGCPVQWQEAHALAFEELGTYIGVAYWERVRDHFFALGGGVLVDGEPVPVATVPAADALAPADEAIAARLLGWLTEKEHHR